MQNNFFDSVPVAKIVEAAASLRDFLNTRRPAVIAKLGKDKAINDSVVAELKPAVEEWKKVFTA
jgi:F0F1-type ATP synthase alpha subunit